MKSGREEGREKKGRNKGIEAREEEGEGASKWR